MVPFRPVEVRSEEQVVGLLRGRREAMGWTQPELDDRIGFPDGYSAKLEAPERGYGRRAVWGIAASLADWLEGLGLCLVIMDRASAKALIEASTDPEPALSEHQPYPGRQRDRELVRQTVYRRTLRVVQAA
jgi:hypothetical protein